MSPAYFSDKFFKVGFLMTDYMDNLLNICLENIKIITTIDTS